MSEPLITIAVACYNVEDFVGRAIASYSDVRLDGRVEVILVDDGSFDGTPAMLDKAADAFPGIFRVIHKDNGGHGSAVNAALDAARGTYFRVVDGDDWVATDELVKLLDILETESADIVVDEKTEVFLSTMEETAFPLPKYLECGFAYPYRDIIDFDDLWPLEMIHTMTMRTAMLREADIHLLEHCFYVDLELVVKATLVANSMRFERLRVYRYLVGNAAQSVADAGYVRHFDDHTRVCKELLSQLGRSGLEDWRREYLIGRCVLAVNTHYNIALIFDDDRKRGMQRAREFKAWLNEVYPEVANLTNKRYYIDLALHFLGIKSQTSLDKLTGRSNKN